MHRQRGLTLIELMFAMVMLAICAMALGSTFVLVTDQSSYTEEEILANNAIRAHAAKLETDMLQPYESGTRVGTYYRDLEGFAEKYWNYWPSWTAGWYSAANPGVRSTKTSGTRENADIFEFAVQGLESAVEIGGQDAPAGEVILYLDEKQIPAELDGPELDLDGSGAVDCTEVGKPTGGTGAAAPRVQLVPVEIRVTWKSRNGDMSISRFYMYGRTD